jgi:3-dehydroquinate synthetase
MENYGFSVLNTDECKEIGIVESIGSFKQLYGLMENEIKRNRNNKNKYGEASNMNSKEKQISFLNNYFIFKKIRNVDITSVYNTGIGSNIIQEQLEKYETEEAQESAKEIQKEEKGKSPKKLKKKLKLKV